MKGLQKLALVTAIAAAPMSGFAMEAMEDEALAAVTGQDGVTITLAPMSIGGVRIDDSNAFTGSSSATGAIFISGISMSGATRVVVDADADTIQAAITLGSGTIQLGTISPEALGSTTQTAANEVISLGSMIHGDITMNVQLGTEDQGSMIALTGLVGGGITLSNFSISDGGGAVTGGSISMNLGIVDAVATGGTGDLSLSGTIDVNANGLVIDGLGNVDVTLGALTLGDGTAVAIGDVSILNLNPGAITITGH